MIGENNNNLKTIDNYSNESVVEDNNKINDTSIKISYKLKKEFFRKTIHMMAAFIPFFYYFSQYLVMTILLTVTLIYFISEVLRIRWKIYIPIISLVTLIAAREKDRDRFILGPITLSMGIFLALTFFDYRSAVISIYALAFGDGVASLFGETIGGWKIPLTFGKTLSGTMGCFLVLFIVYLACGLNFYQAGFLALIAAIIEAFPTGDYDNFLIPVITGLFAQNLLL
jgi:phytol kinase